MGGVAGNESRGRNSKNHHARIGYERPWNLVCGEVDVDQLRVKLSVEYVRARGGLTYEERQLLKARVAEIQRPKEKHWRRVFREDYAA